MVICMTVCMAEDARVESLLEGSAASSATPLSDGVSQRRGRKLELADQHLVQAGHHVRGGRRRHRDDRADVLRASVRLGH